MNHAHSQECGVNDGSRHRVCDNRGTKSLVGTTRFLDSNILRVAPRKPRSLIERIDNSLYGETSNHHRIPLFNAKRLHGHEISAKTFCAEDEFYLFVFL